MWLSTVAIVALVIVAIIAALILIILLTPITYSIEINGRSPYRGEVRPEGELPQAGVEALAAKDVGVLPSAYA